MRRLTVLYTLEVFNLTSAEREALTSGLTWDVDSTRSAIRRYNLTMDQVSDTLWWINMFLKTTELGLIVTPTHLKMGRDLAPISAQDPWWIP